VLRVMTYNIRACLGVDGVRSLDRVARVIADADPDVVALQEVDFVRERSDHEDQAAALARTLDMAFVAGPSFENETGGYGNAVLARAPLDLVRHAPLPHLPGTEPRSAMWVRVGHRAGPIDVINTHLSFRRVDRPGQIDDLLGPAWLGDGSLSSRVVLCGDLNCSPRDSGFRRLRSVLQDPRPPGYRRARCTWPTRHPFRRLDHVLVSPEVCVRVAHVVRSAAARLASDHYPLVAELEV